MINNKLKKIFKKRNFISKLIIPKEKNYKNIKYKIKNHYLKLSINDENMSFVYSFSKLLKISEKILLQQLIPLLDYLIDMKFF